MGGDADAPELYIEEHGDGHATMLLLHGMGATGAVWGGVVAELGERWAGRVVVVDLPGHGSSGERADYSPEAVAAVIGRSVPATGPVVVIGHSYGGYVAVLLASGRYGLDVAAGVATGVKVTWTDAELEGAARFASRPPSTFPTADEAQARYRKVSGLTEDVTSDAADLARGITAVDGAFRLSHDPRSAAIGRPDMAAALAAAAAPIRLSRGETDPMVSRAELAALLPDVVELPGGHNVHVEQPAAFVQHVLRVVDAAAGP